MPGATRLPDGVTQVGVPDGRAPSAVHEQVVGTGSVAERMGKATRLDVRHGQAHDASLDVEQVGDDGPGEDRCEDQLEDHQKDHRDRSLPHQ